MNTPLRHLLPLAAILCVLAAVPGAQADPARTRGTVRTGAAQIEVIAEGEGPLVVLLPSRGRDSEDFDALAARIASAGFRVLRPQPRGAGGSAGPMTGITLHDLASDVAAVITQAGGGPAVIGGHAYGNWVARMTAVDHPSLVRGVVLIAAAAKSFPAALSAAVTRSGDTSLPDAERLTSLQGAFFAPGHDAAVWLSGWHPAVNAAEGAAAAATRQAEWWSAGSVKLLEVQAALDPFMPPDRQGDLRAELGGRVTTVVIPDASHALVPEQPAAVADAIVAWIRGL